LVGRSADRLPNLGHAKKKAPTSGALKSYSGISKWSLEYFVV
jgi:hypothetical protein